MDAKKHVAFGLSLSSMLFPLWLFFVPFCVDNNAQKEFVPVKVLSFESNMLSELILFVVLFALFAVSAGILLKSVRCYSLSAEEYVFRAQKVVYMNTYITGFYYLAGIIYCSIRNIFNANFTLGKIVAIPFAFCLLFSLAFAFIARVSDSSFDSRRRTTSALARFELYVYSTFAAACALAACFGDIFSVSFTKPSNIDPLELNGFEILTSYNSKSAGFQLVAFALLAMVTILFVLSLLSTVSVISKSKTFYGLAFSSLVCSGVFSLLIGLFGKYYEIVQKMNEEKILEWVSQYITVNNFEMEYDVESKAFIWFALVVLFVLIAVIRRPYSRGIRIEAGLDRSAHRDTRSVVMHSSTSHSSLTGGEFDPCPAFSELDTKADEIRRHSATLAESAFASPTLPQIVQFVVNYARDSRLHLSYNASDIAAFIAGLGATRLTILQGMSGTGKTSLPKIFTEALGGKCDIIEIESSWRDKNELLGYYNEFSRIYTPKKFTQALYQACLDNERFTFIVLDEMNLSRIEYYFSDFLSLMEHEEDKREIKLSNIGLFKENEEGERHGYTALIDGHTLKIPSNIWFIGTANRDESTFEISDKVYDRAHTMNFNKRAPRAVSVSEPLSPRYISSAVLTTLLERAKRSVSFDIESCAVIREVEVLLAPYNISFGNRIANQIEDFVKIYVSCFAEGESRINEAVETILLSKVVAKLELKNVENKTELAAEFERLRLFKCSEFIMKLNED